MQKLNTDDLTQVSGGKTTNTLYTEDMRFQLRSGLGEAERDINKHRLFTKLNDDEINKNDVTKPNQLVLNC